MRVCIPVAVEARVVDYRVKNGRISCFHEVGNELFADIAAGVIILIEQLQRDAKKAAGIAGRGYCFGADLEKIDFVAEDSSVLTTANFRMQMQNPLKSFKN